MAEPAPSPLMAAPPSTTEAYCCPESVLGASGPSSPRQGLGASTAKASSPSRRVRRLVAPSFWAISAGQRWAHEQNQLVAGARQSAHKTAGLPFKARGILRPGHRGHQPLVGARSHHGAGTPSQQTLGAADPHAGGVRAVVAVKAVGAQVPKDLRGQAPLRPWARRARQRRPTHWGPLVLSRRKPRRLPERSISARPSR